MRPWRRRPPYIVAGVTVLGLLLYGLLVEPDRLVVRETTLVLPGWPLGLRGLKVAAIADFHAGAPHVDLSKVDAVVTAVNQVEPDLIVLLGDYVTHGVLGGRFVEPEALAQLLRGLHARLGVVAVLGNHDWWFDGPRVRRALEGVGIQVLENDAVRLENGGDAFWLAGLADLWTRDPDIGRALRRVGATEPVLLLTHSPDVFPDVPARVALTLAGHTHGGQVRLPVIGSPIVPSRFGQRYARGHVIEGGRHLFVTTGLGTSILPVRFGVPPEVSVVVLVSP